MTIENSKERGKGGRVATSFAGSPLKQATFDGILQRLKDACQVNTDTALGNALGISQASISKAKSKLIIPPAWIINIGYDYDVSMDWLLYGEEAIADQDTGTDGTNAQGCPGCEWLQVELAKERDQSHELVKDLREMNTENRKLMKENAELRVRLAELEARAAPGSTPPEGSRKIA